MLFQRPASPIVYSVATCAIVAIVYMVTTRHIVNYRRHSSETSLWNPFIAVTIELVAGALSAIVLYIMLGVLGFVTGFLPI